GQSCIAAKRFIVVEAVAEKFVPKFFDQLRSRRMGDPLARETQVGPQARVDLRDELHRQVEESIKRGAKRLLGAEVPRGPGAFYPPTLLAAVDKGMPAFDEETFGPVAAVIRAKDEADAVRLANDSQFGLGAALWTRDYAPPGRVPLNARPGRHEPGHWRRRREPRSRAPGRDHGAGGSRSHPQGIASAGRHRRALPAPHQVEHARGDLRSDPRGDPQGIQAGRI